MYNYNVFNYFYKKTWYNNIYKRWCYACSNKCRRNRGHIYPALAILRKIKQEEADSEFLYIGTTDRMEKDLIPNLDIPYVGIEIEGFVRKLSPENIKTLVKFFKARRKCLKIIKEFKPDVVIGAGGYVTGPVFGHVKN